MDLARANEVVDRISDLAQAGRFNRLVPVSHVGVSSTIEALHALYLVTAETFRDATIEDTPEAREALRAFIRSAGGTGMWVASSFHPDNDPRRPIEVDETVKGAEPIDSFVAFLRTISLESAKFWPSVYSRIGLSYPEMTPPEKVTWWRKLLGS